MEASPETRVSLKKNHISQTILITMDDSSGRALNLESASLILPQDPAGQKPAVVLKTLGFRAEGFAGKGALVIVSLNSPAESGNTEHAQM